MGLNPQTNRDTIGTNNYLEHIYDISNNQNGIAHTKTKGWLKLSMYISYCWSCSKGLLLNFTTLYKYIFLTT